MVQKNITVHLGKPGVLLCICLHNVPFLHTAEMKECKQLIGSQYKSDYTHMLN